MEPSTDFCGIHSHVSSVVRPASVAAGKTTVRLGTNSVTLNRSRSTPTSCATPLALVLPGGVTATLSVQATMTGPSGTFTVNNGASCTQTGFNGPK